MKTGDSSPQFLKMQSRVVKRVKKSPAPQPPLPRPCPRYDPNPLDSTCNPYIEYANPVTRDDSSQHVAKVSFLDYDSEGNNVHRYCLFDHRGAYENYLTSASGLLNTYKAWNKLGDLEGMERLSQAQSMAKTAFGLGGGAKFESTVPILQSTMVEYVNYFHHYGNTLVSPGEQCLTFQQRKAILFQMQNESPKDFSQFIPSSILAPIERMMITNSASVPDKLNTDDLTFLVRCLGGVEGVSRLSNESIKAFLQPFCENEGIVPLTGADIVRSYGRAAEFGTALHKYLEFRMEDPIGHDCLTARSKFPLREPEDYVQAEDFITNSGLRFTYLEHVLASYRHKMCGCVDAIQVLPNGTHVVWDYKRTPKICPDLPMDEHKVKRPVMKEQTLSGDVVKYAVQMAVYRKLLLLNGVQDVSTIANLIVFHPSLSTWYIVELDLDAELPLDTRGVIPGIHFRSTIDLVEGLFMWLEETLTQGLGKLKL